MVAANRRLGPKLPGPSAFYQPINGHATSGQPNGPSHRAANSAVPVSSLINTAQHRQTQPQVLENGRGYYQRWMGVYPYPRDEPESERQDCLHHLIYKLALASEHLARLPRPSDGPVRILDVGCGNGIWASTMARTYAGAEVIAVDLGDVDAQLPDELTNLQCLAQVDFESTGWTDRLGQSRFHFIHVGNLQGSVSDWNRFFRDIYSLLRPAGVLEVVEMDWAPRFDKGSPTASLKPCLEWWGAMCYATRQMGKPIDVDAAATYDHLRRAGFTISNIRSERIDLAEDRTFHPDDCRNEMALHLRFLLVSESTRHFEALSMHLLSKLPQWDAASVRRLCDTVIAEVRRSDCPLYFMLHAWTASKPGR